MYFKLAPISLDPAYKAKDVEKAKGTGTSMSLCVTMQVFDSGLIGEGVLHMLAAAKQKLLTKDAILVPAAATVFCQPLQMRIGQASTVSSLSPVVFPPQAFPSLAFCFCPSLSAFPSLSFPFGRPSHAATVKPCRCRFKWCPTKGSWIARALVLFSYVQGMQCVASE